MLRLENINCPLCKSGKSIFFLSTFDRFDKDKEKIFRIVKCGRCGLIFLNPRVPFTEISQYYSSENYDPFISIEKSFDIASIIYKSIRNINLRIKYHLVSSYKRSGKILDYGTATGEFLETMRQKGWETYGVELDDKSCEFANKKGLNVYKNINEIEVSKKFDVITMWHSLEHIHELNETIKNIIERLNENGFLIIAVPNIESYGFNVYKEHWIALDSPRHLYHFTYRTIKFLFKKYNMDIFNTHILLFDTFYNHIKSFLLLNTKLFDLYYLLGNLIAELLMAYFESKRFASTLIYVLKKVE
ncbi:MAG: class I SAM-dependent methyltransferase [Candidatus Marinimicrobia bacterium]|nr:class I SAM-dependent methyltransferase [Candidatus Neomarinimicrobiota bacterium]